MLAPTIGHYSNFDPGAVMQSSLRESTAATHSSKHKCSSTDGRTDECTHFCLHRTFLRRGTQRLACWGEIKSKTKGGRRRTGVHTREREGRKKKGRDGSRRVHNNRARAQERETSMRAALNTSASHYVINVRELHERYVSRMRAQCSNNERRAE